MLNKYGEGWKKGQLRIAKSIRRRIKNGEDMIRIMKVGINADADTLHNCHLCGDQFYATAGDINRNNNFICKGCQKDTYS